MENLIENFEYYETIYEIFESVDNITVIDDTENQSTAKKYFEKGYIVDEHRIYKRPVDSKTEMTLIVTTKNKSDW